MYSSPERTKEQRIIIVALIYVKEAVNNGVKSYTATQTWISKATTETVLQGFLSISLKLNTLNTLNTL